MDAYIYQAELLCDQCGEASRAYLDKQGKAPADPTAESTYDSDDYPKGPYPNGGGLADTPQHCGHCSIFLENPLTIDGEEYVSQAIEEAYAKGRKVGPVLDDWEPFYRG